MDGIAKSTLPYFLGMDLADLAEGVPLSEESGFVDFMSEARELTAAVKDAGICLSKTKDQRGRALFLMRGFYLLGVLRGGEAARAVLLDAKAEGGGSSSPGRAPCCSSKSYPGCPPSSWKRTAKQSGSKKRRFSWKRKSIF